MSVKRLNNFFIITRGCSKLRYLQILTIRKFSIFFSNNFENIGINRIKSLCVVSKTAIHTGTEILHQIDTVVYIVISSPNDLFAMFIIPCSLLWVYKHFISLLDLCEYSSTFLGVVSIFIWVPFESKSSVRFLYLSITCVSFDPQYFITTAGHFKSVALPDRGNEKKVLFVIMIYMGRKEPVKMNIFKVTFSYHVYR